MIPADSSAQSGRWNGYLPDANEINGYIAAERRFKPPSKGIVGRLIDFVREGNLLHVISGEQANLPDQPSWYQKQMGYGEANHTLCNIPATARAVWAPREKPTIQIDTGKLLPIKLRCAWDRPNRQTLSPTL